MVFQALFFLSEITMDLSCLLDHMNITVQMLWLLNSSPFEMLAFSLAQKEWIEWFLKVILFLP